MDGGESTSSLQFAVTVFSLEQMLARGKGMPCSGWKGRIAVAEGSDPSCLGCQSAPTAFHTLLCLQDWQCSQIRPFAGPQPPMW